MDVIEEIDNETPGTSGDYNFLFDFGQNDETVESEGENELMFLDQGLGPDRDFDSSLIIPDENLDNCSIQLL